MIRADPGPCLGERNTTQKKCWNGQQQLLPVRPLDRGDPLGGDQAVRHVIRTGREKVGVPELCFSHGDQEIRPRCHNRFPTGVFMSKAPDPRRRHD